MGYTISEGKSSEVASGVPQPRQEDDEEIKGLLAQEPGQADEDAAGEEEGSNDWHAHHQLANLEKLLLKAEESGHRLRQTERDWVRPQVVVTALIVEPDELDRDAGRRKGCLPRAH